MYLFRKLCIVLQVGLTLEEGLYERGFLTGSRTQTRLKAHTVVGFGQSHGSTVGWCPLSNAIMAREWYLAQLTKVERSEHITESKNGITGNSVENDSDEESICEISLLSGHELEETLHGLLT